jgi:hypothetical protein
MTRVKRGAVAGVMHERRRRIVREWGKHRSLQRFLHDHAPLEWEKIRQCQTGYYRVEVDTLRDEESFRVYTKGSCHQVPWCIMCTQQERNRRLRHLQTAFQMCTPAGKEARLAHIVQVAPCLPNGSGWGYDASKSLTEFFEIVNEQLQWAYGDGIGWYGSYQDFGEKAFRKRHPHIDLTLNGYKLDEEPNETPRFQLKRNGLDRWSDHLSKIVRRHYGPLIGPLQDHHRSVRLGHYWVGFASYWRIANYQVRELVDLRKLTYNRDTKQVWWANYRDGSRTEFTVNEFLAGLAEYQVRLGQWGHKPAQQLHRGMGHMAKRSIRKTMKAMDGHVTPHRRGCTCSECGDWQRVFLEESREAAMEQTPLPQAP